MNEMTEIKVTICSIVTLGVFFSTRLFLKVTTVVVLEQEREVIPKGH